MTHIVVIRKYKKENLIIFYLTWCTASYLSPLSVVDVVVVVVVAGAT